jgi:hypothetical protein
LVWILNPRLDDYLTLPDVGVTNISKDINIGLIVKYPGFEDFTYCLVDNSAQSSGIVDEC